eukprot:719713-Prymnesium_polylepis.1
MSKPCRLAHRILSKCRIICGRHDNKVAKAVLDTKLVEKRVQLDFIFVLKVISECVYSECSTRSRVRLLGVERR